MANKSFRAARAENRREPIMFDIGDQTFSVARPLPGFVVLDLAEMSQADGEETVKAFVEFFHNVFPGDEYERFRQACEKEQLPLNPDKESEDDEGSLVGIVQYVIEQATARPTQQRSDSVVPHLSAMTSSSIAAS